MHNTTKKDPTNGIFPKTKRNRIYSHLDWKWWVGQILAPFQPRNVAVCDNSRNFTKEKRWFLQSERKRKTICRWNTCSTTFVNIWSPESYCDVFPTRNTRLTHPVIQCSRDTTDFTAKQTITQQVTVFFCSPILEKLQHRQLKLCV